MKKGYFVFSVIILFSAMLFGGAFLVDFRGYSEGENGRIEWETGEESNLKHFIIERKTPETSNWIEVVNIQPKGSNSFYSYVDESIFKQNNYAFNYQLKIVENNGQYSYSRSITITLNPSSVKSTWGSIKAMFR